MLVRVNEMIDKNLKAYNQLKKIKDCLDSSDSLWVDEREKLEAIITNGMRDHLRLVGMDIYDQWKNNEER